MTGAGPQHSAGGESTRQDILLRFAASQGQDYEYDIRERDPLRLTVESDVQPPVEVGVSPDQQWCTCDEDITSGTCTHVLFLASLDNDIGAEVRATLARDLELLNDEIEELQRTLDAREVERAAIDQALKTVADPSSE